MTGVERAKTFVEGYRPGRPLKVENRAGMEHLVAGQQDAQWSEDGEHIELSYVPVLGHSFIIMFLEKTSLEPVHMVVIDGLGLQHLTPPDGWKPGPESMIAIESLRAKKVIES